MVKETTKLTDSYIKKLLKAEFKSKGLPVKEVESGMIDAKRTQLQLESRLKEPNKILDDED